MTGKKEAEIRDKQTRSLQSNKRKIGTTDNMKEEISLEMAELGNLSPKHEPMTPNKREKAESEKNYK